MNRAVQVGRVVLVTHPSYLGKLAVIVEIIDTRKCLIDGPKTGVPRQVLGFRQLTLTDLTIDIARGARTGTIARKWDDDKIQEGWRQTPQARKIRIRKRRNELNDFERFVALRLKKQRHYEVKMMFEREDREKKKATG